MSSSNKSSNTRLALYSVPVAIGTLVLLGDTGGIDIPNVELLSSVKAIVGDNGFKVASESLKLIGSLGGGLLTSEGHDRIKQFFGGLNAEELFTNKRLEESIKRTIISILETEKNNPKYEKHTEDIERVIRALNSYYDAITNIEPEEIDKNIFSSIFDTFKYNADDLSKESSPLNANEWKTLLTDTATITDTNNYQSGIGFKLEIPKDFDKALTEISKTLEKQFPKTFQNYLEKDFAENKETYAKFVLDFLKRINNSGDEIKAILAEQKISIEEIKQNTSLVLQQGQINQSKVRSYLDKVSRQIENLQNFSPTNENGVSQEELSKLNEEIRQGFQIHGNQLVLIVSLIKDLPSKVADEIEKRHIPAKSKPLKDLINFDRQTTPYFVQQGNIFDNLDTHFRTKQIANLRGFHGLGKSTTVLKYAEEHRGKYEFVLYVLATTETIEANLAVLADKYLADEVNGLEPHQKAEKFKEHLEKQENGLIIFDNLESIDDYDKYFPLKGTCKILYTSNDELYRNEDPKVELPIFSQSKAELFVYKRVNVKTDANYKDIPERELEKIRKLIEEMGVLPNALNVASAFINKHLLSSNSDFGYYDKYIDYLRGSPDYILKQEDKHVWYQNGSLFAAYGITLDNLKSKEGKLDEEIAIAETAKTIIELCALCSPDQIPQDLIQNTTYKHFADENPIITKDLLWTEAETLLKRLDVIRQKEQSEIIDEKLVEPIKLEDGTTTTRIPFENKYRTYDIHRSLQKVLVTQIITEQETVFIRALMQELELLLTHEREFDYKHNIKYSAQANKLLKTQDALELNDNSAYVLSLNLARYYENKFQYQSAAICYERSLSISRQINGENHSDTATSYHNLALLYKSQGRYEEAEPYYLMAVKIKEKVLGENHSDTATSYSNLAMLYRRQERYEELEPYLLKALKINEKVLGENHPDTATSYNNLASLYYSQENYKKSETYHLKALKVRKTMLGEMHPDVAQSYWWIGVMKLNYGNYHEALESCKRALKIFETTLPIGHPRIQKCKAWIVEIKEAMEK